MSIDVLVSENSSVRLWGLTPEQRLKRQLHEISKTSANPQLVFEWPENRDKVAAEGRVLWVDGNFLFEVRTLVGLLQSPDSVLLHDDDTIAAAHVDSGLLGVVLDYRQDLVLRLPKVLNTLRPADLATFDESLRRSTPPLLEPVSETRRTELESQLYGNAYRGITDLVTKFLWPRPAKRLVHLCAKTGITPNMVTTTGLVLVIAACYLFLHGQYGWGLLAGWIMTLLDTVDGKLARVTVRSSKFGHLYDHAIDLFHPPFWYIFWGMSLYSFEPVLGLGLAQLNWLVVIAYVGGRIVEGLFPLLGDCSIFTWRPYDAWFRLVTARRNPCLILLTLSILVARPDWGFVAVVFWSALTTLMLVLRLLQAVLIRLNGGPLHSWLSEPDAATGPHARSYSVFGATRGAYSGP